VQKETMNKLGVLTLLRLVFVLVPVIGAVSFSCYTILQLMKSSNLERFMFVPNVLALTLLYYLSDVLVLRDLKRKRGELPPSSRE
jgi:Na+/alanine symporter